MDCLTGCNGQADVFGKADTAPTAFRVTDGMCQKSVSPSERRPTTADLEHCNDQSHATCVVIFCTNLILCVIRVAFIKMTSGISE